MLGDSNAYSGIAVNDLGNAREFYEGTLGLNVEMLDERFGLMTLHLAGGRDVLMYMSEDMTPASYTVLNFPVDDIDEAVDGLSSRGVAFERYKDFPGGQDEKGIARGLEADMGPSIAWFKDPSGNVLSVLQEA